MKKHYGFSYVIIFIVFIVLGGVGLVAWRVYDAQSNDNTAQSQQQSPAVTPQATTIESAKDVAAAEQELNSLNFDSELDSAALDADIRELQ